MNTPHLLRAFVYFSLALIITTLFVLACPLYISQKQLILSLSIAGGKWAIQLIAAIAILRKRRATFIHGMARVCLLGSLLLVPYIASSWLEINNEAPFFFGSLMLAVLVMVFRYHTEVTRLNLSLAWWYFWLLCLTIAVGMQLTVVFHLF
ncbi:MAG: hypothetical protein ACKO6Q_02350 [Bacteroidota bacterium]